MYIKNEIINFIIQKESDGSLLFTGKWGCGKTFLINKLISENKENLKSDINSDDYVIALVSLYGLDSINSIHDEVKKAILDAQSISNEKDNNLLSKIKKVAQPITEALSEKSQTANALNLALSITPLDLIDIKKEVICYGTNIKKGVKKRLILIFDDLERCNIPVLDILGVVNHYTESKGIKTIIIANEEKIQSPEYRQFKEKVISRTIYHFSDHQKVIEEIIENYHETPVNNNYVCMLKENLSLIIEGYQQSGYNNYRLLKRALIDFERVYNHLCLLKTDINDFEELMSYLLYQFLAIYMEVKSGSFSAKEMDLIFSLSYKKYRNFTFSFVPKFVTDLIILGTFHSKINTTDLSEIYKFIIYHKHKLASDASLYDWQNCEYRSSLYLAQKNALNHKELLQLLKLLKYRNEYFEIPDPAINTSLYCEISQAFDKYQSPSYISHEYVGIQLLQNAYNEVEPEAAQIIVKMEKLERAILEQQN